MVKRQTELVLPSEIITSLANGVITYAGSGETLGKVGGMGRNLICHHASAHIILVGQSQMFLGCDIAEEKIRNTPIIKKSQYDSLFKLFLKTLVLRKSIGGRSSQG